MADIIQFPQGGRVKKTDPADRWVMGALATEILKTVYGCYVEKRREPPALTELYLAVEHFLHNRRGLPKYITARQEQQLIPEYTEAWRLAITDMLEGR